MSRRFRSWLRIKQLLLFFLGLACVVTLMVKAADGDLDASFGNRGKVTTDFQVNRDAVRAVALQNDGKIVAAARAEQGLQLSNVFVLARYLSSQGPPLITVANTNNSGPGSLRQAIVEANSSPGAQTIIFKIPGSGVHTISPTSPLPTITDPIIIDGYTQPGASPNTLANGNNAVLLIQLNGSSAGSGVMGLRISGGNSTVRGLVINNFRLPSGGGDPTREGVGIFLDTRGGNVIEGNFIGTNSNGTTAQENAAGVSVQSSNNKIGGTTAAARNILSGNRNAGIFIVGNFGNPTSGNEVQGNFIGTNTAATAALANQFDGLFIIDSSNNIIGGTTVDKRNIISGNGGSGINIFSSSSQIRPKNNLVLGNYIGTDVTGTVALGNGLSVNSGSTEGGVSIRGASDNTIGGITAGAGNLIAFNSHNGVLITGRLFAVNNVVVGNAIFSNGGLGIDLGNDSFGGDGVTPNDPGDADTGTNNLQNFPVLTSVVSSGSNTVVQGTLNSTPSTTFNIQFFSSPACDPSGNGEGQTLLGSTSVTTNGGGNATINTTLQVPVVAQFVTATATDPNGNTSEFSACSTSLQFSSATYSASEGAGTTTIIVTRTGGRSGAVSVQYSTVAGGTATGGASCSAGVDFVNTSGTLNWADGDASNKTFAITICNDNIFEGNQTASLRLSNASGATLGSPSSATLTIIDDDLQPTISINDVMQAEGNSGTTNFAFTVSLSNPSTQTVTVNYATANGTATAGSDYQAVSATTLTFNPGVTSLPVNVPVIGDTLDEANETFFVNLAGATNATIADNQGVGTINDDDPVPNLTISDVSQAEGNSGTTSFNFIVGLSAVSGRTVTVNYATADGTAIAGSDYQGIGVTALTFTPGQTSKAVTVLVNGDTANEPNETFFVNLSGAANANITDGQGQGTILNDDATRLSINDVSVTEGNSGTVNAVFTVSLSPASGQTVTLNYATADGTATAGGDYQAINSTALTFNPGETSKPVTVVVIGDTLNEADETVFVNLTNATNATIADSQGVGTITNDDPVPTGNLKISGRTVDDSALSISGLLVILGGAASGSTTTDSDGNYSFNSLDGGNYTVTPSSSTYSFSPASYTFNNLNVNRIANFVATQTIVSISGKVTDANNIGLNNVTVALTMNGATAGTSQTDVLGNYSFGSLAVGANYAVTPAGSFTPSIQLFSTLTVNATANFRATPSNNETSLSISGRLATANNNPLAEVTVTVSGPVTRVSQTDAAGNYVFSNLSPGGNYSVTIQSPYYVFVPSRVDFFSLSSNQTANFMAAPVVVPAPPPPPSDDFTATERDANKWSLGTQTQPPTAFDPQVRVAQINGQLMITPLSQVSGLHYNGYVSANSFDMRGGSVSVELVQAATGGADTIFAIGSDSDNFYRFMVRTAGPGTSLALTGRDGIEGPLDTTVAQLLFQVNVGGQLTSLSIPYDPVAHRFMRFRHDAPANAIVFETSPNNIDFTERHRVILVRSVSALTAELSAGTSNPANPGPAVFDNFSLVTSTFQFSSASYTVDESGGSILITVTRAGSTAATAAVGYATADDTALQTTKYINAAGRLTFAPGEASKTFRVLIIDNAQAEGNQNLNLLLQEPVASGLNAPGRAVLTIIDNDTTVATSNPLDAPTFFVTQHYYDFLNREPDAAGLAFWVGQITSCGTDTQCIEIKRINVSAAYFLSIEFQETGLGAIRTQRAAFGRKSDTAALRLPYTQFMQDAQQIGNGVVFGQPGADTLLEQNKQAYATEVAASAAYITRFPLSQMAAEYVDALFASAMVTPTVAERDAAIAAFGGGGSAGRVAGLRSVADSNSVRQAEFNAAFVLMQYYGYLRRNPTDLPDTDDSGYQFWLGKLNQFNGNFVDAEMVKAFITSGEYRRRFGP